MATSSTLSTSNQFVKYTISVTQNSQSITGNSSNVTVAVRFYRTNTGYTTYGTGTVYCKINGTTHSASVTPSQKITNSGIVLFTKTLNIAHGSDGVKTLTCSAWISHNAPLSSSEQSYSQALSTIPRKSTLTVSNGTLGTEQTLTVAKKSSGFTHTIVAVCGGSSATVCTKSGSTSISFTPRIDWSSKNTSGTTVSVKYTITTYSGDTSIGSNSYTVKCAIPSSVKPSCNISVSDYMGYYTTYGGYLKGLSKIQATITPETAHSSPISSYRSTANGTSYASSTFVTSELKTAGTSTITASVTDKRGRTGTASTTITILDYSAPMISSVNVGRCNSNGTDNDQGAHIAVTFNASITPISNQNGATYALQYKKTSEATWTDVSLTSINGTYSVVDCKTIFAADTESSYDIRVSATDNFGTVMRTAVASTAFTLLHFKADGTGIGIGKVSEEVNTLDVGLVTRLNGGLSYPELENGTDFDTILTPNNYILKSVLPSEYSNCPFETGTGMLLVESFGEVGQIRQTATKCLKTDAPIYERYYYESSWGAWQRKTEVVLYNSESGSAGTITLSESCENFKYLEIYYTDNNGIEGGYLKLYSPNGKEFGLSVTEAGTASNTYVRRTAYTISGTSVTPDTTTAAYVRISGTAVTTTSGSNYLKIKRITGHE